MPKKEPVKLTVPILKKRLDALLKTVRYRGTGNGITNECATCHGTFPIKELQCGHFVKRGDQALKYDEHNLAPQCVRCNKFLDGAQDKFAYYVIRKYGVEEFNRLIETDYKWAAGEIPTLKRADYVAHYNYWLAKTRAVEKDWDTKLIPTSWQPAE